LQIINYTNAANNQGTDPTVTINPSPSITTPPSDQTACSGGSVSFTVVAAVGTFLSMEERWRRGSNLVDGGNISGATTQTLTINPAAAR
jgi:hypothetical protein